ncbi:unnamed protein product [Paramecium pentaurelia]|uniref:Uncharacterized protein n=1 Tax=Paramecium pentaurelia TaxID=43138 RepID=A0A8S1YPG1_9CILI|nr:unnamed protein product [Paramecium pentaurelia]
MPLIQISSHSKFSLNEFFIKIIYQCQRSLGSFIKRNLILDNQVNRDLEEGNQLWFEAVSR